MKVPSLKKLLGVDIDGLTLRWATPAELNSRVAGTINEPTTINHETRRPEPGGLFCEEVFGPRGPGLGGEVPNPALIDVASISPAQGNSNFGVIELPVEIVHPLWLTVFRDELTEATGWSWSILDAILQGTSFYLPKEDRVVTEEQRDDEGLNEPGQAIYGGVAVRRRLESRGVETKVIISELLIVPTHFRPLFKSGEDKPPGADLNDLYRRVINRNYRLKRLVELDAPEIIIRNERRMIQEGAVALFDNSGEGFGKQITGPSRVPLVSLLDGVNAESLIELSTQVRNAANVPQQAGGLASPFEDVSMQERANDSDDTFDGCALPGAQLDSLRRLEAMGFSVVPNSARAPA